MPPFIATFFAGKLVEVCIIGALLTGVVAWRTYDVYHQRGIGAARIVDASKKMGEQANAKSEDFRAAADKPGAAQRLRKSVCRDCGGQ